MHDGVPIMRYLYESKLWRVGQVVLPETAEGRLDPVSGHRASEGTVEQRRLSRQAQP